MNPGMEYVGVWQHPTKILIMSWDCDVVDVHKKGSNMIHTCAYTLLNTSNIIIIGRYQVSLCSGTVLPGGLTPGLVPGILGSQL